MPNRQLLKKIYILMMNHLLYIDDLSKEKDGIVVMIGNDTA